MSTLLLLVCAVAVLIGAIAQRVTGLGFALVVAPFLVLALGPVEGVIVSNLCGMASGLFSLVFTWRNVDIKRTLRIATATIIGFLPGIAIVRLVANSWLAVIVSALVLLALVITLTIKPGRTSDSWAVSSAAGLSSGFLASTASVGGPPLAIYGRLTAWELKQFAASMQALSPFILIPILAAPTRPEFSIVGWVVLAVALFGGVGLGNVLAPHLSGKFLGRLVMIIAFAGALTALVRAIIQVSGNA